jgi:hypothetical protein
MAPGLTRFLVRFNMYSFFPKEALDFLTELSENVINTRRQGKKVNKYKKNING